MSGEGLLRSTPEGLEREHYDPTGKVLYWRDDAGRLNCSHGMILYGTSCAQCERGEYGPWGGKKGAAAIAPQGGGGARGKSGPRRGDWIQTFTGRQYWPLDPRADEVAIEDIAHALSMLCRYTGHCEVFYSVAEHSVHVSHIVDRALLERRPALSDDENRHIVLHALLHDAAEAYCNDIARPVKRSITGYAEIESLNELAIMCRFQLPPLPADLAHLLKQADSAILLAEQAVLMKAPPATWAPVEVLEGMVAIADKRLAGGAPQRWTPAKAERIFLARFAELTAP